MSKVRVEDEFHEFYRVLARDDGDSVKQKTFDTMRDVFVLAFGFGVAAGRRTPLGKSREIFDDGLLRPTDLDMIRATVLADDEDSLEKLEDSDHLVRVAQEYANTGIRIMRKEFLPSTPEESLAAAMLHQLG